MQYIMQKGEGMRLIDADEFYQQEWIRCGMYEPMIGVDKVYDNKETSYRTLRSRLNKVREVDDLSIARWINVKDRLPEKLIDVLVLDGNCKKIAYLSDGRICPDSWKTNYIDKFGERETLNGVTHWMPLPEPPKE